MYGSVFFTLRCTLSKKTPFVGGNSNFSLRVAFFMQNDFIDSKIQMQSDDILLMDCPSQAENFTFLNCKCYWKQWYFRVFVGFWIRYPNNSHTSRNVFWGWIFFWGGVHLEIFCIPLPNMFLRIHIWQTLTLVSIVLYSGGQRHQTPS